MHMRKKYESPALMVSAMDMDNLLVGISDNGFDPSAPQEVNSRDYEEEEGWNEFWDTRE